MGITIVTADEEAQEVMFLQKNNPEEPKAFWKTGREGNSDCC
jgi:hypothetical protein